MAATPAKEPPLNVPEQMDEAEKKSDDSGALTLGGAAGLTAVGGLIAGPVGAVAGLVIGGVAGLAADKLTTYDIDDEEEQLYWKQQHPHEPYHRVHYNFDEHYAPAYRVGGRGAATHVEEDFDAAEPKLRADYEREPRAMPWTEAREPAKSAWRRIRERQPQPALRKTG